MNSPQPMNLRRSVFRALLDLLVTLLLWVYFLAGTLILPFYGMAHLFSNDRKLRFRG